MALDASTWLITFFLLIILFVMALGYTYAQRGQMYGFPGRLRYAMFGVAGFVLIGVVFLSYVIFLYLMEGIDWSYLVTVYGRSYDFANGVWTALVGAAIGIFLGIFAFLKKQELFGR